MALNRAEPLELVFNARDGNVFVNVNDTSVDSERQRLMERGIIIGDIVSIGMEVSLTVTFQNFSVGNNNTKFTWFVFSDDGYESEATTVTIVGEPSAYINRESYQVLGNRTQQVTHFITC